MTTFRLSPRDRRTLAAGVIIISVILTLARGVPTWRAWNGAIENAARTATADLTRDQALLHGRRGLSDTLAARATRLRALRPVLFSGETSAAATAALGSVVSGAALSAGITLGAVELESDSVAHGGVRRIAARGDATGDVRGIATLLATLELGPRRLSVRAFRITQSDPAAADDHPEALRLEFTVEGLMRADTSWRHQ